MSKLPLLLKVVFAFNVTCPPVHAAVLLLFSVLPSRVLVAPLKIDKSSSISGSASTVTEPPTPLRVPPVHSNRSVTDRFPVPPSSPPETSRTAVVEPLIFAIPPLTLVVPDTS